MLEISRSKLSSAIGVNYEYESRDWGLPNTAKRCGGWSSSRTASLIRYYSYHHHHHHYRNLLIDIPTNTRTAIMHKIISLAPRAASRILATSTRPTVQTVSPLALGTRRNYHEKDTSTTPSRSIIKLTCACTARPLQQAQECRFYVQNRYRCRHWSRRSSGLWRCHEASDPS